MKRIGRKRLLNPIAIRLSEIMKALDLTKEQICVNCNLKYHALENVWKRRNVSYATLKSLQFGGAIDEKVIKEYTTWIAIHPPKGDG